VADGSVSAEVCVRFWCQYRFWGHHGAQSFSCGVPLRVSEAVSSCHCVHVLALLVLGAVQSRQRVPDSTRHMGEEGKRGRCQGGTPTPTSCAGCIPQPWVVRGCRACKRPAALRIHTRVQSLSLEGSGSLRGGGMAMRIRLNHAMMLTLARLVHDLRAAVIKWHWRLDAHTDVCTAAVCADSSYCPSERRRAGC
jgi:hypothetical protein